MIHFRHKNFDLLFFLGDGTSPYARQVGLLIAPKKLISFFPSERDAQLKDEKTRYLLIGSPIHNRQPEFLEIMKILNPFSKSNLVELDDPPFLRVSEEEKRGLRADLGLFGRPLIGIHLSARRPKQRWPLEYFEQLTRLLNEQHPSVGILITWSPGDTSNVEHPGDDLASARLKKRLDGIELIRFCPTESLGDLLHVQSICNVVFCADGGAMHTAAALGIRVVAIFGDSNPTRWRPIGDGHIILASDSTDVADISVNQVHRAISSVLDHAYD